MRILKYRSFFWGAVATMVLAIASVTVVLIPVNALWIKPRSALDTSRLVVLTRRGVSTDAARFSDSALEHLRTLAVFDDVAGQVVDRDLFTGLTPVVGAAGGGALEALGVTSQYFRVLGAPIRGRDFAIEDDLATSAPVAVISDDLWHRRFGGRADVLGQHLDAGAKAVEIIGIAPPDFRGAFVGENVDVWIPHNALPTLTGLSRADLIMPMIDLCRLAPGQNIAAVRSWLAMGQRPSDASMEVLPLSTLFAGGSSPLVTISESRVLAILSVTACIVLIGGCGTLMALVLVHYEGRRSELALRIALGAGRWRLVRLLILELGGIVLVSTAGALVVADVAIHAIPRFVLPQSVDLGRVHLDVDWRITVAATAACTCSVAFATLWPIRRFTVPGLTSVLLSATVTAVRSSLLIRRTVIGLQAAAAFVVLVLAALFVNTVWYGFNSGAGFNGDTTIFVTVQTHALVEQNLSDADRSARGARDLVAVHDLMDRLRHLPGIAVVTLGSAPVGADRVRSLGTPRMIRADADSLTVPVAWLSVGPRYFEALGSRMLAGSQGESNSAVISMSLADTLWQQDPALGHSVGIGQFHGPVSGVVDMAIGSVRLGRPAAIITSDAENALPRVLSNTSHFALTIKAASAEVSIPLVSRFVDEQFPSAPLKEVETGTMLLANDLARERLGAWFFTGFGIVAFVLGVAGIFGLVSHVASSRRREFGIMLALGASLRDIQRLSIKTAIEPSLIGIAAGAVTSLLTGRFVESFLLGARAVDVRVYAAAALGFLAAGTLAGLVAVRGLQSVGPAEILRNS